jgi:hypothetical protein
VKRLIVLLMFALASCQSGGPLRQITNGTELANYNFSDPNSFEQGAYGAATLRVEGGRYAIEVFEGDNTLWWGQWGDTYSDVVIEADITQTSERTENAYGVMCRVRGAVGQPQTPDPELAAIAAESTDEFTPEVTDVALEVTTEATSEVTDEATEVAVEATAEATDESTGDATTEATSEVTVEATEVAVEATAEATDEAEFDRAAVRDLEGDGYLFLIQGTGSFAIMRARGRDVTALVDWRTSDKINVGPATNRIRAVCAGNYLALYINGEFMADVTDDSYASGQIGLAASAANRLGVRVEYDNLSVYEPRTN